MVWKKSAKILLRNYFGDQKFVCVLFFFFCFFFFFLTIKKKETNK